MINFDSLTLSGLIEELYPVLVGSRVHKVQQPNKNEILLTIRSQGKHRRLIISAHPRFSYISLLDFSKREFLNPEKPPMFCMLLRKHMKGSKILDITQPDNERILEIHFESFNELEDRVKMTMSCEIMGKYSNVILYMTKSKLILGCAHNVGEFMSSQREVAGSLNYVLPPPQNKINILDISKEEFVKQALALDDPIDIWLNTKFFNISLALAREFCHFSQINIFNDQPNINTLDKINHLYDLITQFILNRKFQPSLSSNMEYFSLLAKDPTVSWNTMSSINHMTDVYFDYHINKEKILQLQSSLKSIVNKELKRINNRADKLEETINKAQSADKQREKADLIMANLQSIKPGLKSVQLENFYDNNKSITIELDPSLTANQNAQKIYKIYHKAKNGYDITFQRLQKEKEKLSYLENLLFNIQMAHEIPVLEEIKEEIEKQIQLKELSKKNVKEKEKLNILTFISSDNLEILVGRNNKQNDYLISKLAHVKDMWLHTQIAHGSHVIIKTDQGTKTIPETTLHEAALLAGYYSEGRHSSNVNVVYTIKKFVKKPTGANPGFVVYSNEQILYVNPLEEHVNPILARIKN